jgi:hypothetical protein
MCGPYWSMQRQKSERRCVFGVGETYDFGRHLHVDFGDYEPDARAMSQCRLAFAFLVVSSDCTDAGCIYKLTYPPEPTFFT